MIELDIPLTPPSLNTWQRSHWAVRRRIKNEWTEAIWALCNEQRVYPMEKMRLRAVIRFAQNRKRDEDNYLSTTRKLVQDALVRIGMIPDDTLEHVEFGGITMMVGVPGTTLYIEEAE